MSEIKINNIPVITENNGSVELTTGSVITDTISESTAGSGVTIDGLKIKDTGIQVGGLEGINIDSSGRVTMPYRPAFASIKANSDNYASLTPLDWTVVTNIGGHFNGSKFTAPVSGMYHFNFGGITHSVSNYFAIGFQINGVPPENGSIANASWRHLPVTAGEYSFLHTSLSVYLNVNDYITASTGYNGGTPYLEQYRSSFCGFLIG